ncbi:MAG: ribosome maturation factor RimP [Bacilli bacterium]|nr:ribosome maturation factor RimP [Bacilli bacterium]
MNEEERVIAEALNGPLGQEGYELLEVRLSGGKNKTLSVVVDRPKPISLEDIVDVSGKVSDILDKLDPIKDPYTLDVSSAGAEKPIPLGRLPEYVGSYVNLHLSHPYKGENVLEGTLLALDEDTITLQVKDKARKRDIPLPRKDVDKARLAIEF